MLLFQILAASGFLGVFILGLFARLILRGDRSGNKVNLQTTTVNSLPVLVNHDATVRMFKVRFCIALLLTTHEGRIGRISC